MTNLYGHKFTSVFGEAPHEDWITVFSGVTGRQIADGLNRCLTDYPEWPPGAAQLRAICLGLNPRNIDSEGNDSKWQHAHIEAEGKKFWDGIEREKQLRITDKGRENRTLEARDKTLAELRGLFK